MSKTELSALLVNQYQGLQPFAVSLTRDNESAKDLCQETLYRALSNMDKYQLGTNLRSWLYTIMRNIYINDYRKKKTLPAVSGSEVLLENHRAYSLNNTALQVMTKKEIEQNVHALSPVFRPAFILYTKGYKYNEIAEMLNEPLGTIKSRIHFARKTLQQQISKN